MHFCFVYCYNRSWSEFVGYYCNANLQFVCKRKQPEAQTFWTNQVATIREFHGGPDIRQFVSMHRFSLSPQHWADYLFKKFVALWETEQNSISFFRCLLCWNLNMFCSLNLAFSMFFHANIVTSYVKQVWSAGLLSPFVGALNLNNYICSNNNQCYWNETWEGKMNL